MRTIIHITWQLALTFLSLVCTAQACAQTDGSTPQLIRPKMLIGAFLFSIDGPPGIYTVLASTDLATWTQLRVVTNSLGKVNFVDAQANLFPRRFYRVLLQGPPTNMVFIPTNTFTLDSPTLETGSEHH